MMLKSNKKLKNVLFNSYILVALIPLVVIAFISLYLLSEHIRQDSHTKNSLMAELTANEISMFIQGKVKSLNILCEALNSLDENDSLSIKRLLNTTIENHTSIESIFLLDRQGDIKQIAPYDPLFIGFNYSTSSFFIHTTDAGRIYTSDAFLSPRTNQPTIIIAIPYNSGVIAGMLNLSSLSNIINKITPGRLSHAAITDGKGTFIAHSDQSRVKQRESEENFSFFKNHYMRNKNFFWLNYDDKEVLTSVAFIDNPGWAIIIYQDSGEALSAVRTTRSVIISGIALSLVFVLMMSIRRTNSIIRPVSRLIEKTKNIAKGDYSTRLEYVGYFEFNELIDEYNLMIDNIFRREKHYSSLFYNSRTKMLLIDAPTQTIIDVNSAAASFFGMPIDEIKNRHIGDFNNLILFREDNTKGTLAQKYTIRMSVKDSERFLDVYASPLQLADSSHIYLIIHDITDRVMAEKKIEEYNYHLENLVSERTNELKEVNEKLGMELERIRQTEEKLRDQLSFFATVLNTVPVPIFIRDLDKKYIDCNKFFEQFIGKSRREIIGRSLFELIEEPFAGRYSEMDDKLLASGSIQRYEYKFPLSGGDVRDVIFNKAPLLKADGKAAGVVGSFQDITEHKKMETEIQNALNSEKELNELKTRFISTTSHEFRTPLTAILSSADLMELYGRKWPEEKFLKHTSQIRKSVKYMTELLDDILIISRAESGKMVFNPAKCNLHEIICDIIESLRFKARENHHLEFEYLLQEKYFMLDEKLLRQIISNLMSNAIKYSPDGGLVRLEVSCRNSGLIFQVSDEGIGIPEEEMKNLMAPFYRTRNAAVIPGTGLGLSIVKKSVEVHGGHLSFESTLGKGSIFSVSLPLITEVQD